MVLALALWVLADIGPPPPECIADRDCVLTTFVGCCGACCPGVRAAPKGKDERAACATMRCATDCATVECSRPAPDLTQYVAACVRRRCEAVLKDAQCRQPADCRLVDAPPAGATCAPDTCCCPVKQAQPLDAGVPAAIAPAARCATCPPEPPMRATCLDGRCAAVPEGAHPKKKK